MKTLTLCSTFLLCMACSARPVEGPTSSDQASTGDTGSATTHAASPDTAPAAPRALSERLELILQVNVPVQIAELDLTVTLLDAHHTTRRHPVRGFMHSDVAVIRFERVGEAPVEMKFGPERDNHVLFGHGFAVFGGTQLSVFPPGAAIEP